MQGLLTFQKLFSEAVLKAHTVLIYLVVFLFVSLGGCGGMKGDEKNEGHFPLKEKKGVLGLDIKGNRIWAEVVRKEEERVQGLMFRTHLGLDSGMLFVFENDETLSFWMKNTYIPLAIAFIDSTGIITDILEMQPLDTLSRYRSSRPVRYALEVNSGWFFSRNIKPGDTVSGIK